MTTPIVDTGLLQQGDTAASYWLMSRSYKVQGNYLQEAYLVGLIDDVAGLGGLAVSLAARELGLSKGNMLKRSG